MVYPRLCGKSALLPLPFRNCNSVGFRLSSTSRGLLLPRDSGNHKATKGQVTPTLCTIEFCNYWGAVWVSVGEGLHTYLCVHICVHLCMSMQRPEDNVGESCCSITPPSYSFKAGSLTEPGVRLEANEPRRFLSLTTSRAGVTDVRF